MMNFTIYADNDLIYNRLLVNEHGQPEYLVKNPVLNETTESFCSLTYTCEAGSPAYDLSVEMIPRIKVYENANLYWTGRILKTSPNIYREKDVYVEDFMGVLCDGVYRPFAFYGTASALLQSIVNANNSQVGTNQQIYSVVCDVDVGNIYRSSEGYSTCWSTIQEKLLKPLGGYIWMEYDNQERAILHYSMNPRNSATQEINFGENLKSYDVEYNFEGFYTAIIPLGKKDNETKQFLTIADVNDGIDYLIDETSAARYGVIYAPPSVTTWDDVESATVLKERGIAWLQNQSARLIKSIKLEARDIAALNQDAQAFRWLDAVRVNADEINDTMVIKNLKRPLDAPVSISISMGDSMTSLVRQNSERQNQTAERIGKIESDYTTEGDVSRIMQPELEGIRQETITQITSIKQEVNEIILSALEDYVTTNDLEQLRETISAQLAILADRIEFNFTSTNESISEVDGRYNAEINSILSFIRLLPTTQTQQGGVVIGESTSEIKLKLENDILYFFTGDETTVSTATALAYFSAGQLVVDNSRIKVLSIGTEGSMMHMSIVGDGSLKCLFMSPRRLNN